MKDKSILVTGGAGYIGSVCALRLLENSYKVIVLDNLVYGHEDLVKNVLKTKFIKGDIGNKELLRRVFKKYKIDAVFHFSAYAFVGESVKDPLKYYQNNFANVITLIEVMKEFSVHKIIFSSTCATYGNPKAIPIQENHPQNPVNPYGNSKLMVEKMLKDADRAYNIKHIIFRYFNAAGADPNTRLGEDHSPETHLIPLTIFTGFGKKDCISIFGDEYDTKDGTCIRDYIHVTDLARAHIAGYEYLEEENKSDVFNLGNKKGYTVKEVIKKTEKIMGKSINTKMVQKREGDPPVLIGSNKKANLLLNWKPEFELEDIIEHAVRWHKKRHIK